MNTDSIEKKILLHAPLSRVWRALSDSREFGLWFGVRFEGPFVSGETIRGKMTPTVVDADVAAKQKAYEGTVFEILIERIEPQRLLSFRWHPYAIDPNVDYSSEPTTLVSFTLTEVPEGVELTIVESGFDAIPLERRADAFSANEGDWTFMLQMIDGYLRNAA